MSTLFDLFEYNCEFPDSKRRREAKAAGEIHMHIEPGSIRAEIIGYDDLVACGSRKAASEKGLARLEGKEYIM